MKLCLFFSYGVSLADWKQNGQLDREIRYFERLRHRSIEIVFFTYGSDTDIEIARAYPWLKVVALYSGRGVPQNKWRRLMGSLLAPWRFREYLKKVDVYRSNQMLGAWVPALAACLHGKRFICRVGYEWASTMQKAGKSRFYLAISRLVSSLVYRRANRIIVTSPRMATQIQTQYKIPAAKISVLPNFIDTDLFKPSYSIESKTNVLFVGRLSAEKNIDHLMRATATVGIPLVLVGSGPEENRLRALAQELGAQVDFVGSLSNIEVSERLKKATIFALISEYEGNPKALLEAMASGAAILGSRAPGIVDLLQPKDGIPCGVVSDTNPESLATEMRRLLDQPDLRTRLGAAACARATELCAIQGIVEKEALLYVG